jgi:hypothetical protein
MITMNFLFRERRLNNLLVVRDYTMLDHTMHFKEKLVCVMPLLSRDILPLFGKRTRFE